MESHQTKEEDVLFMDIEKRILLLVNDDEEEAAASNRYRISSGNSVKRSQSPSPLILEEMNHFSWRLNEREQLLSSKQRNRLSVWLPRESNGTGVFIPNHPTASKTRCEDGGVRKSTSQPLQGRRHFYGRVPCTQ